MESVVGCEVILFLSKESGGFEDSGITIQIPDWVLSRTVGRINQPRAPVASVKQFESCRFKLHYINTDVIMLHQHGYQQ